MSDLDILEFLDGHALPDYEVPPTAIAVNMDLAEGTVWNRVRVLRAAGLIERTDETRGYYKITGLGQHYLAGELTDDERQQLEEFDPSDI
ncbi:Winged helix-turn-helix transcription repressor, HrcA DNA-binding [Haladaptatus litoreus]|uniref:Winged helix-turn-helix transcription repressor, HrcA DNA-binding n=1 Tax=Haladaptatus litoreus TaxID=553468 RepID=A0A1N7FA06_9EURY|nr:winged helix-turn-helix domain-containing protein [Haladaptatus litoreus]SIR97163.1 Winged helix-turn-helix transcription repressor, HrcA DNA-binding [Haladaptatus litoreus]